MTKTETGGAAFQLTSAELIYVSRALPHFLAGKTVEEAMAAVLEDDNRLGNALFAPEREQWLGFDESACHLDNHAVKGLRSAISATVYRELRARGGSNAE